MSNLYVNPGLFLFWPFFPSVLHVRHRHKGAEQRQRQSEMIERGWIDGENNGANFLPAAMILLLPKTVFSAQFDALCVHTIPVTDSLEITSQYFSTKQDEYFMGHCFLLWKPRKWVDDWTFFWVILNLPVMCFISNTSNAGVKKILCKISLCKGILVQYGFSF